MAISPICSLRCLVISIELVLFNSSFVRLVMMWHSSTTTTMVVAVDVAVAVVDVIPFKVVAVVQVMDLIKSLVLFAPASCVDQLTASVLGLSSCYCGS